MDPTALVTYKNVVLTTMSASDIARLAPHLFLVDLPRNQTLQEPGKEVEMIYFLEEGICSILATMGGGESVEVGIIGRDGFVGLPAVLGAGQSPNRWFMQIPGYGFRVRSKILIEQFESSATLRLCLLRSVQGLLVQTAQTAACNRVHDLHQRLARRLLMCRDRFQVDCVELTQEFLATMLGTRRSSVTVAVRVLQRAGLITYRRGHVTIEDRAGLRNAACECYQVVHDEYVRLGLLPA
jgi:CRP-like cAMP-binding protein